MDNKQLTQQEIEAGLKKNAPIRQEERLQQAAAAYMESVGDKVGSAIDIEDRIHDAFIRTHAEEKVRSHRKNVQEKWNMRYRK